MMSVAAVLAAGAGAAAQSEDWAVLVRQAKALEVSGDYGRACARWRDAARAATKDAELWPTLNALAAAERDYKRVVSSIRAVRGMENADYAIALSNLASLRIEAGDVARGTAELQEGLAIAERTMPAGDVRLTIARSGLAGAYVAEGRYEDAARLFGAVVTALERGGEPRREQLGVAMDSLGEVKQLQGRQAEAVQEFEGARTVLETRLGPDHPGLVRVTMNLASGYAALGRGQDADAQFRRAVALAARALAPEHPLTVRLYERYAAFLEKQGRKREAKEMAERGKQAQRAHARRNGTGSTVSVAELGR
jgi:tetratricopeptide (TPR) repeat protein